MKRGVVIPIILVFIISTLFLFFYNSININKIIPSQNSITKQTHGGGDIGEIFHPIRPKINFGVQNTPNYGPGSLNGHVLERDYKSYNCREAFGEEPETSNNFKYLILSIKNRGINIKFY